MNEKYEDIIHRPYIKSTTRPHMPQEDRAAQFAPFAALTGHKEAITETSRLTQEQIYLEEEFKTQINQKLNLLQETINSMPQIDITYFVPDKVKSGGKYITKNALLKKIDLYNQKLIFADNTMIPLENIIHIDGEIFEKAYSTYKSNKY